MKIDGEMFSTKISLGDAFDLLRNRFAKEVEDRLGRPIDPDRVSVSYSIDGCCFRMYYNDEK